MSIKRINTMTGTQIRQLLDRTAYCATCEHCPLKGNDTACLEHEYCLDSIMAYMYEDVESDSEPEVLFTLSTIATSLHNLIVDCMRLSGNIIQSDDFARMIADRISEEHAYDC